MSDLKSSTAVVAIQYCLQPGPSIIQLANLPKILDETPTLVPCSYVTKGIIFGRSLLPLLISLYGLSRPFLSLFLLTMGFLEYRLIPKENLDKPSIRARVLTGLSVFSSPVAWVLDWKYELYAKISQFWKDSRSPSRNLGTVIVNISSNTLSPENSLKNNTDANKGIQSTQKIETKVARLARPLTKANPKSGTNLIVLR